MLHFTLLQILGFNDYLANVESFNANKEKYLSIVKNVLSKYLPFDITFRGVIAIKSGKFISSNLKGLIMTGFPSIDVNSTIRKDLDAELEAQNLYKRSYTNNIVHSTILRFSFQEQNLAKRLLCLAEGYRDCYFGKLTVDSFEVGHSSWRMQSNEISRV